MTDVTQLEVIEKIQDVLDSNIDDPNAERNGRWIYNLPIKYDISDYPRIHIHDISATHQGLSIGSTERWVENRIQISVFCAADNSNSMDIDNDGEVERPNKVVSEVGKNVVNEIKNNQSQWRSLGDGDTIHSVLPIEEQLVQDDKNSVIQQNIDCLIKMVK